MFALVTAPDEQQHAERHVTWTGEPGRQPLVAKGTASEVTDPAGLAAAVDQGRASDGELTRYGGLFFDAVFGQQRHDETR